MKYANYIGVVKRKVKKRNGIVFHDVKIEFGPWLTAKEPLSKIEFTVREEHFEEVRRGVMSVITSLTKNEEYETESQ